MALHLSAIPLRSAYLCVSCETVAAWSVRCPKCGAEDLWPISAWLSPERIKA